jgi:hypothetical protein
MRRALLAVVLAVVALVAPAAQSDPTTQPRVQAADMDYLGSFTFPNTVETELSWAYGGGALGMGPSGTSVYLTGHAWYQRLGRVSIPTIGGIGAQQVAPTLVPNLNNIDPGDGGAKIVAGSLLYNNRLLVSAYTYYDGDGNASASHFVTNADMTSWTGPYRVGSVPAGWVGGYMGLIPSEWRTLFGGPALTGLCCTPIISRTSYGPSVSVFDPDTVGVTIPAPATTVLGYPADHPLTAWNSSGSYFNGATAVVGVAFVPNSRSVLFIGRVGTGTFCYGPGTATLALAGTSDGEGGVWCYDPLYADKGTHAYPYVRYVWAYDANDLVAVKAGTMQRWEPQPYATWALDAWPLDGEHGNGRVNSATFDPNSGRLYLTQGFGSATPRVHVYRIAVSGSPEPPPPPPPAEVCGDSIDNDGDGQIDEGCNVSTCTTSPLLASVTAWPSNLSGARQAKWRTSHGLGTTGSLTWTWNPQRLVVVDSRGCTVTVTR